MKHLTVVSRQESVRPAVVQSLAGAVMKADKKGNGEDPPLTFTVTL